MARVGVKAALLVAFLFASGAPLVVFWLWPHAVALERELDEVRERHLLLARTLAASLDHYFEDVQVLFSSVAPRIAAGDPATLAKPALSARHFRHLCVADPTTGRVLRAFLTEKAPCPEVIPAARREMFEALVARGPGAVSDVKTPNDGGPPRLFMAMEADGKLVVAAIGLQRFADLAGEVAFGESGHAAIVDATGRLMAHPRAEWVRQGRYLATIEPVRRLMSGQSSGVASFVSPAMEEEVISGFAIAPKSGWAVIVPQPMSELRSRAMADHEMTILVFLFGIMLSVIVAAALAHRLGRGLHAIERAAAAVGSGARDVRIAGPQSGFAFRIRELEDLAARFGEMAERITAVRSEAVERARVDALTGLLNRGAFLSDAQQMLNAASETEGLTLFFIDVDRLKAVNDGFGHSVGDALLRVMGERLRMVSPPDALVARQGGDEFLVLRRGADREASEELGAVMRSALARPIELDGRRFVMSTSIGASFWPRDGGALSTLISHADRAMYEAKQAGRNNLRIFDDALRSRIEAHESLKRALHTAIAEGGIGVAFQPVTATRGGAVVGFEALARWAPDGAQVSPERFVRLAEEAGLIKELGRQVRMRALAFGSKLRAAGLDLPIALNVSETELFDHDFVDDFAAALAAARLPPSAVILEITESDFDLGGDGDVRGLAALREAGLGLALDDFGKGHSPYRRLRVFPVDRLKIDLAYFGDVSRDARARATVRSLVGLGHSLDLTVTLEGVATGALQNFASELGVDECQGFWRHPPLSPDDALALAMAESGPMMAARG